MTGEAGTTFLGMITACARSLGFDTTYLPAAKNVCPTCAGVRFTNKGTPFKLDYFFNEHTERTQEEAFKIVEYVFAQYRMFMNPTEDKEKV